MAQYARLKAARRAFLLGALMLAACGRRDHGAPLSDVSPAPRDSVLAAIAPKLNPWMPMWREAIPGFTLDSLTLGAAAAFVPELEQTLSDAFFDTPRRQRLFHRWSRDSAYSVDPNVYLDLADDGTLVTEPDNAMALVDRREGRWERLMGCGTPCRYFDALWVGDRVFVEAAWYESDETPGRWAPALHVFDLETRRSWRFDGPMGGPERLETFQRAIERRLAGHPVAANQS